jgi:5S rRNA maturation endonuclease (ribonuclease M5)
MEPKTLKDYILEQVKPEEFYSDIFDDIHWGANDEARVRSPWVDERTPSLSINRETGAWYSFCESDQGGGPNIISFWKEYEELKSEREAQVSLFDEYIHPIIPEETIRKWQKTLQNCPTAMKYITQKRGLSEKTIKRFRLGWDGHRIMFPIYNEFGICVNAKRYDMAHKKGDKIPKMLHYTSKEDERSFGSPPMLYPLNILMNDENREVVLCEGEWDTLALLDLGIAAVTGTSGAKTWPHKYAHFFTDKDIIVCYDNDETGRKERKRPLRDLPKVARSVRVFDVPHEVGKDIDDMIKAKGIKDREMMLSYFNSLDRISENESVEIDPDEIVNVSSLDQASHAKYEGKQIQVNAFITGKNYTSYRMASKYRVSCSLACEGCKLADSATGFIEKEINTDSKTVLELIEVPKATVRSTLMAMAGVMSKNKCMGQIEELRTVTVEKILLIPEIDPGSGTYTRQIAYFVGHNIAANRSYSFIGRPCAHPKSQLTTFIFTQAIPVQNEIETFEVSKEMKEELKIFRTDEPKAVKEKLEDIAEWQAHHLTKIYGRSDLHTAIDLAYHSPLSFEFNGEYIHKASLDVLVLGDTRTGKGFVVEGLKRYYGAGDLASGENCTQRGLIGACQKVDGEWMITWGMFPINHNRLVVIDELSSLSESEISELTRVRSEGVAEIVKVVREATQANLRIISLSNPRSGRQLKTYNNGPTAVKELIGANEDISRFDFILTVASEEVDSKLINQVRIDEELDYSKYPQKNCRDLVFWVWSRKPDQIKFSRGATQMIINQAVKFGQKYSSSVPIVQSANFRFKLAKLAAAVAGRTYSSDRSGQNLIIRNEHVKFALEFLDEIYHKASMGYDMFSKAEEAAAELGSTAKIDKTFIGLGSSHQRVARGLYKLDRITIDNLTDYAGDRSVAQSIISELVNLNCLQRIEKIKSYIKNPEFRIYLQEYDHGRKSRS